MLEVKTKLYNSHLSVLEKILTTFEIGNVLEFGLGIFSTPLFVKYAKKVVSIEQMNEKWQEIIKAEIKSANWRSFFQPDPQIVFDCFDNSHSSFDLVFSDGDPITRCIVANLAMKRNVPFVVLHDAEQIWCYRWDLLDIPPHYSRFNYSSLRKVNDRKVTTVLTNKDKGILDQWRISDHDRVLLSYSSENQPVIQFPYDLVRRNFPELFNM